MNATMTTAVLALVVAGGTALIASPGLAQDDQKSLEKCQKAASKETAKFAAGYQKTAAKCLDKVAMVDTPTIGAIFHREGKS